MCGLYCRILYFSPVSSSCNQSLLSPPLFFLLFLVFQTDPPTAALVFAHVCRVMTFVPADCTDQLFVLCLDFVSRPLVSCTSERLRMAVNSLSSEVYKAALIQKLSQNM